LDEFAVYAEDKIDEVSAIGVPSECPRGDLGVTSE
jgi:hypothetical protein